MAQEYSVKCYTLLAIYQYAEGLAMAIVDGGYGLTCRVFFPLYHYAFLMISMPNWGWDYSVNTT